MATVEATIVVQFGDGADTDALVVVELDGSRNLDADGNVRTSFHPGDEVYFSVHHDATVQIARLAWTDGSVQALGPATLARTAQVSFPAGLGEAAYPEEVETVQLAHHPTGGVTVAWYGRDPGLNQSGRDLHVTDAPGIGEAAYQINAQLYRLTGPNVELAEGETWPVLVVVHMEAA